MERKIRRIALLQGAALGYDREVLKGVRRFVDEGRPWVLRLFNLLTEDDILRSISAWKPDGVLFRGFGFKPPFLKKLDGIAEKAVSTTTLLGSQVLPNVCLDNNAVGELAAGFLLQKEAVSFAFAHQSEFPYDRLRRESFTRVVEKAGKGPVHVFCNGTEKQFIRWLLKLPKPCALFASTDSYAQTLSTVCLENGIGIPEEILLLGVDNDELICEFSIPPISSIAVQAQQVGYEAAAMLERYLEGKLRKNRTAMLPPAGVIERRSTDMPRTGDPVVNRALQFIALHAVNRITVPDVAREVHVCRRLLERRFRSVLGRSPLREIIRVRMDMAQKLLRQTRLSVEEVASRCGYMSQSHFIDVFKKEKSVTPGTFRKSKNNQ